MAVVRKGTDDLRVRGRKVKPDGGAAGRLLAGALGAVSRAVDAGALLRRGEQPRAGRAQIPTVAIHGLALGGVGKTPLCLWLAPRLAARLGGPVAVGTRSPAVVRDEIEMIVRGAPSIPVFSDDAAPRVVERARRAGCRGIVLDDPSLSRPAPAHVRIVCLGPGDGWDDPVFPVGGRRPGSVRPSEIDLVALADGTPPPRGAGAPALRVGTRVGGLLGSASGGPEPPGGDREGGGVYLLCGVARPERVLLGLGRAGVRVMGHEFRPDHSPIPPDLRAAVERAALAAGAAVVAITPKDAARLPRGFAGDRIPWASIDHRVDVDGDLDALWAAIDRHRRDAGAGSAAALISYLRNPSRRTTDSAGRGRARRRLRRRLGRPY